MWKHPVGRKSLRTPGGALLLVLALASCTGEIGGRPGAPGASPTIPGAPGGPPAGSLGPSGACAGGALTPARLWRLSDEQYASAVSDLLPGVTVPDVTTPGRSKAEWIPVSSAGIGKPEPLKEGGLPAGNVLLVKDLLSAIDNDRQPECNMYEARTTIEMIAGVFESHRVGGPVTIPLKTRENPLALL